MRQVKLSPDRAADLSEAVCPLGHLVGVAWFVWTAAQVVSLHVVSYARTDGCVDRADGAGALSDGGGYAFGRSESDVASCKYRGDVGFEGQRGAPEGAPGGVKAVGIELCVGDDGAVFVEVDVLEPFGCGLAADEAEQSATWVFRRRG